MNCEYKICVLENVQTVNSVYVISVILFIPIYKVNRVGGKPCRTPALQDRSCLSLLLHSI